MQVEYPMISETVMTWMLLSISVGHTSEPYVPTLTSCGPLPVTVS